MIEKACVCLMVSVLPGTIAPPANPLLGLRTTSANLDTSAQRVARGQFPAMQDCIKMPLAKRTVRFAQRVTTVMETCSMSLLVAMVFPCLYLVLWEGTALQLLSTHRNTSVQWVHLVTQCI